MLQEMLTLLERTLPVGPAAWAIIEQDFAAYATTAGRPARNALALQKRYRRLLKGEPTGQGGPSARQHRARNIEARTTKEVGGALYEGDEELASDEELDEEVLANESAGLYSERMISPLR